MTKNLSTRLFFTLALTMAVCMGQVFAQSTVTGGINGTVTDPQGSAVPNAPITVTNLGTNSSVTVTSDSNGAYRVTNLQPGTYKIETTVSGFAPALADNIIVEVGKSTPVDIPLVLGTATAEVNVTAEAPVVNTNDNANSNNFNQTSINELPINGRRWSNFAVLSPSAVPDGTFGLISFRGISGLLNNNTIDGGDNNQAFFSEERGRTRINYSISQAAIREFQVNTSNYSAEYGRSAGGVTNAVTKSGTNEFHGELFYYNRNNRNGARNPRAFGTAFVNGQTITTTAKPIDLRQQWGGAIGGPIVKDRVFFFFSYDQQKRNFPGLGAFVSPSFLNLTSAQLTRLTGAPMGTPQAPTGGAGLTTAQVNNALTFLNSLTGEVPRKGDQTLFFPKIDWQINDKHSFSISYNRLRWDSPNGIQTQAVNNRGRDNFGDDFVDVDSVNARLQSSLSANWINEFRFQYGRDNEYQTSGEPAPGAPLTAFGGTRTPNVFITNGLEFGVPTFLERAKFPFETRYQFADNVTYVRGRHTFKFGADINRVVDDISNLRFEAGAYSYNNLADFVVDFVNWQSPVMATNARCATTNRFPGRCYTSNFQQGIGSAGTVLTSWDYNFFIQDDFRVSSRLTVNLGLRYEYIKLPSAQLPNTNPTGVFAGSQIIPNDGRTITEATSTLPSDKNNFGPRVGMAYDITGDGKTSFRAGYGIYYGRIQNSTIYNAIVNTGNPGGQAQLAVSATSTNPVAPIFPNILQPDALTFATGAIQFFSENFQAPLIHQYDAIFERQIMKNTSVSVSYIGSLGRHLPTFFDLNNRLATTGSQSTTYTLSGGEFDGVTFTLPRYERVFGSGGNAMTQIRSTVKSQYDALVLQANRRFTDGIQFTASYTLAKSTDTNQNSATFTQTNSPYDIFDGSYDVGNSNFDTRHKLVLNAVFSPTLYKGSRTSFLHHVLNGWTFSPIFAYYSGRPFSPSVSGTSLNASFGDNRLPIIPRNSFRLPALINMDARLSKRFKFTESMALEILAEAFNIANRTHVFGVNSAMYTRAGSATTLNFNSGPSGFGAVTSTDSTLYRERQIQFATRFQF